MTNLIIGLIVSMVFSAFFSGMEIAFVSSNRLRAEMDREKNGMAQRALDVFYRHPNNFVSTMLVGNNIALVVYGILFAKIFDQTLFYPLSDGMRVMADTLLSTIVVLFTGEFLPKTIFKSNPNTMLTVFALPAYLCYLLLYPISRFATLLSRGLRPPPRSPMLPFDSAAHAGDLAHRDFQREKTASFVMPRLFIFAFADLSGAYSQSSAMAEYIREEIPEDAVTTVKSDYYYTPVVARFRSLRRAFQKAEAFGGAAIPAGEKEDISGIAVIPSGGKTPVFLDLGTGGRYVNYVWAHN